jgi:20S proteasome subunit beta 2
MVSSNLELHRLATGGRVPRVVTACAMLKQYLFSYQGHVSAYLVLGGVDPSGASLYTVAAHGSTDRLPFVTMGSGSLAAMSIFEDQWREGLELEDAVRLVQRAIMSGVENDLGSGGNIDITIITKDGVDIRRNSITPNERPFRRAQGYVYARGTTAVTSETYTPLPPRASRGVSAAPAAPAAVDRDADADDKAMKTD